MQLTRCYEPFTPLMLMDEKYPEHNHLLSSQTPRTNQNIIEFITVHMLRCETPAFAFTRPGTAVFIYPSWFLHLGSHGFFGVGVEGGLGLIEDPPQPNF